MNALSPEIRAIESYIGESLHKYMYISPCTDAVVFGVDSIFHGIPMHKEDNIDL